LQTSDKFSKHWGHYGTAEKVIIAEKFWDSTKSHHAYSKNNTFTEEFERNDDLTICYHDKLSQNNLLSNITKEIQLKKNFGEFKRTAKYSWNWSLFQDFLG